MGVVLVCTSNHCCIHLKWFHSAVVTCTNKDNSYNYRSLHNPCNTEKHRVSFHIWLRLHSHCTKISFHIWKLIQSALQGLCKLQYTVHRETDRQLEQTVRQTDRQYKLTDSSNYSPWLCDYDLSSTRFIGVAMAGDYSEASVVVIHMQVPHEL